MADREVDFLLIGGGMASAHCASELRKRGAEGSILLAGRESEPPYERPPLSKEYMRGEAERKDAYVNPRSWYEENGVELLTGVNVMSLDPAAQTAKLQGGEEVGFGKAVLTKSGRAIECDAVVVGAGVRPDAMLAQRAGLEVDDGILCNSKLTTSAEGIYAAGDCCSYDSVVHGRRIRVEHWDVAMQQGMHAAGNMLGEDRDYDVVPYFFSDLADWASLEYVGPAAKWDEEIWRGDREGGEVSVWYLKDGKGAGALSVGRSEDLAEARRLLPDGVDVSAARRRIADAGSDLSEIS